MPPRRPVTPAFDHRDWLALIDYSGPFLSVPVLKRHWPAGLDPLEKPQRERLRREHLGLPGSDWITFVLRDLLEWGDDLREDGLDGLALPVPEHDTVLMPDFALYEPGAGTPCLLGAVSAGQPTARVPDSEWSATPADRMMRLLRHHKVELGLVTDGRWWTLLRAPGTGGAATIATFDAVNWNERDERDVVRAFVSLLRRSRFFSVPEPETLPALIRASEDSQEEITERLGVQVRQAVELLVLAIGRANAAERDAGRPGFLAAEGTDGAGVPAREVYRAAVAVMMRVVFLLFAEERGLLPSDKELYVSSYGVGQLLSDLRQRARDGSETDLEHSKAAWGRLLATFNAVYHGVGHPELRMHAHGGSIFDPERYAWLPATIDDRTVLHMLHAVQEVRIGTGRTAELRRLSFNQLDVEQIGYVYEGLLSYDAFYAEEPVLGLVGKEGEEAEVPLSTLLALRASLPDDEEFAARLSADYKAGTKGQLLKRLAPLGAEETGKAEERLLAVTRGDYALTRKILPLAGIIRDDLREQPYVILTDALYVTESPLRKNTGTHYTPKRLAEEIVEGALEPLVFHPGPLQTADTSEWVPVSAEKILSLKVADIAMGSAAFLVAACRYLARHLVDAWVREEDPRVLAYRDRPRENAIADDADPLMVEARRQIIEHCLYGVDINEMAVEMAKLSLWLVSMDPERPFTFLDDRLVCGDALLGVTSLDQLEWMHLDPAAGRRMYAGDGLVDLTSGVRELVASMAEDRRRLTELDGTSLEALAEKEKFLRQTIRKADRLSLLGDLIVGAVLANAKAKNSLDAASGQVVSRAQSFLGDGSVLDGRFVPQEAREAQREVRTQAEQWLHTDLPVNSEERRPLHWPLVFPEVFTSERAGGGFDAIIGNPPFLGGKKITGATGVSYREYLVRNIGADARGHADLVAYFVLRSHALLNGGGQAGLIATNTLAQGDTREVGLQRLSDSGVVIRRSIKSAPWPSRSAVLEYCAVWTSKELVSGKADRIADGVKVTGITPSLDPESRVSFAAQRLARSSGLAFIGAYVLGMGFVLEPDEAKALIEKSDKNRDVLFPYLNGQDVNSRPDISGSRWVINFHDWSEERSAGYGDVFDVILKKVKPERQRVNSSGAFVLRNPLPERYWQYADKRPALLGAIAGLLRVIVITLVSKTVMPVMVPTGQVFAHKLGVFATDDTAMLTLLSSAQHYNWVVSRSSTMKTDINYSPSDVFETFALPEMTVKMRELGERLDGFRRELMLRRQAGLTKTYNLVHDPKCVDADIEELRGIHRAIDEAVCWAYGWDDLVGELGHGHHDLGRETRYTVAPAVQREFVDRLLELNQERYTAEVAAGLHEKKSSRVKADQGGLF